MHTVRREIKLVKYTERKEMSVKQKEMRVKV